MIPGLSGLKPADALAKWHDSRKGGLRNYTEVKRCELVIKERVKEFSKKGSGQTTAEVELQHQQFKSVSAQLAVAKDMANHHKDLLFAAAAKNGEGQPIRLNTQDTPAFLIAIAD